MERSSLADTLRVGTEFVGSWMTYILVAFIDEGNSDFSLSVLRAIWSYALWSVKISNEIARTQLSRIAVEYPDSRFPNSYVGARVMAAFKKRQNSSGAQRIPVTLICG
jgi:hypothetical protein